MIETGGEADEEDEDEDEGEGEDVDEDDDGGFQAQKDAKRREKKRRFYERAHAHGHIPKDQRADRFRGCPVRLRVSRAPLQCGQTFTSRSAAEIALAEWYDGHSVNMLRKRTSYVEISARCADCGNKKCAAISIHLNTKAGEFFWKATKKLENKYVVPVLRLQAPFAVHACGKRLLSRESGEGGIHNAIKSTRCAEAILQ